MAPLYDIYNRKRLLDDADRLSDDDEALLYVSGNKRVRFELHSKSGTVSTGGVHFGTIVKEDVYESELALEDFDKEELWWSRNERAEMADFNRKLARGFKKQNSERVKHYLNVFEECSKPPSHASSDFLEKVQLGVPTQVRGLECGFIPSVKSWRRKHAHEILDTQGKLVKGNLPEAMCCQVLSSRAMLSSRPSRVMARLIGEADALP